MVSSMQQQPNFIGSTNPMSVKILVKELKTFEPDLLQEYVALALKEVSGSPTHSELGDDFNQLVSKHGKICFTVYPGVLHVMRMAFRLPRLHLKRRRIEKDLTEMSIPDKFHGTFCEAILNETSPAIDHVISAKCPQNDTISSFRWRIDVAISTTDLNRVLEQSILVEMKTNNNENIKFEMSKQKFHELRHSVAFVLNQMQQIEKRSILQIDT